MYRYLAIARKPLNRLVTPFKRRLLRNLLRSKGDWTVALDTHELIVVQSGAQRSMCRAYDLSGFGCVLGRLFRNAAFESAADEVRGFTDEEHRRMGERGGEYLATRYWGRYVAFTLSPGGRLQVFRDPSGGMPVYFCRLPQVDFIFSHLEDCLEVLEQPLSINWDHIRAYLTYNRMVSPETGYNEVQQLRAGESVELEDGPVSRSFHWSPVRFAEEAAEAPEDPDLLKSQLHSAVRHSVRAWASCHRRILHELSGGLDSSIVLACLATDPGAPEAICFNLYTEGLEGDERALARAVSQRYGCPLVETPFRPPLRSRLEDLLVASNQATPQLVTLQTQSEEARQELAAQWGAEAIYSGQGGDHLFHRRQSPLVAAEYVQRYGLGRNGFPIVLATARMAEQPVLSVLSLALRFGVFQQRYDPYAGLRTPRFVSIDAAAADITRVREQINHPWIRSAQHLPAAKCQQIADLIDTQCFSTATCTYADVVHPLISQPLIECCLRIPTYRLTQRGIERGLARAAFSNDLPPEVIERTAKGDATAYYHQLILQNLGAIREWLLDGWLVREQLLDRPLLEEALSENALIDGYAEPYILAAMMAEAWIRNAATACVQPRGLWRPPS